MTHSTPSPPSVKRGRGRPRKDTPPIVDSPPENPIVKRKVGRPKKIDYGFDYVLGLARIGMTDVEIQAKLKLSHSTWFRYLAIDDNREMLTAIRIAGKDDVKNAIFQRAMAGDTGAARLAISWLNEAGKNSRKLGY
jgi:hypothetical protein